MPARKWYFLVLSIAIVGYALAAAGVVLGAR
jgi:hypothetical protein